MEQVTSPPSPVRVGGLGHLQLNPARGSVPVSKTLLTNKWLVEKRTQLWIPWHLCCSALRVPRHKRAERRHVGTFGWRLLPEASPLLPCLQSLHPPAHPTAVTGPTQGPQKEPGSRRHLSALKGLSSSGCCCWASFQRLGFDRPWALPSVT